MADTLTALPPGFQIDTLPPGFVVDGQKPEPDHDKANAAFASTLAEATKREPPKETDLSGGNLYAANLPMDAVKGSVESVLNVATGFTAGFPAYLGGGLGTVMARDLGWSDEDPKEVASRYAEAVTFQPTTESGKQL